MGAKKSWVALQSCILLLEGTNQAPWGPLDDCVDVVTDVASALVARTPLAPSPLHQKTLISISLADSLHGL